MKKQFIVALATTLILANGASAAFADSGSDSDKSTNSVSSDDNREDFKLTKEQKAAFKVEREAWKDSREVIREAFKTAKENAKEAFKTARELATTDEARKAAEVAFTTALSTARQTYLDALKALGPKPEKPALTAEQLAVIAKFRQDMITFKAELAIFKGKVEAIRAAFKEALKALGEGPVRPEAPDFNS